MEISIEGPAWDGGRTARELSLDGDTDDVGMVANTEGRGRGLNWHQAAEFTQLEWRHRRELDRPDGGPVACRLIEKRQDDLIDRDEAQQRIGRINTEKVAAREELERAPEADAGWCRDKLGALIDVWAEAHRSQKNALLGECSSPSS